MPPKAKSSGASKKTEQKKKEKIIEDKTFGMKNKKGSKQQKLIQQIQNQVKNSGNPAQRKLEEQKKSEKEKKLEKKKELKALNEIFRPVVKIEKTADPKTIVCPFHRQGTCTKGNKCKFSHDLTIALKVENRNAEGSEAVGDDDDDDDDDEGDEENTVNDAESNKTGEPVKKSNRNHYKTCKHMKEVLDKKKYTSEWVCPDGVKCVYSHVIPQGYVFKEDKGEQISIEDLVERERVKLPLELTKITLETFLAWKKKKLAERQAVHKKSDDKKKVDFRAGKNVGISGREMFTYKPEMASDDRTEEDEVTYDTTGLQREDEGEEQENVCEVTLESVTSIAQESDNSGTVAKKLIRCNAAVSSELGEGAVGGSDVYNGEAAAVPIDENLFVDDDLEDLDEELDDLNLNV